jgi:hypothetical protein
VSPTESDPSFSAKANNNDVDRKMKSVIPFLRTGSPERLPPLDFSERLFLWGFRAMVEYQWRGRPIIAAIRQVYGQFHVEDAVASLDALLQVFACTMHTAIEVHSPCCPCVSESEAFLLRAIAAVQAGSLEDARRRFEHWLPELAADWILTPACGLGRVFQAADMTLPLRDVGLMRMHETAMMHTGSQSLH